MRSNVIVKDIGEVVEYIRNVTTGKPYYDYGHKLEIANNLKIKNQSVTKKVQKYPLIVLILDTPEKFSNGIHHYNLNLAILEYTNKNYSTAERYENIIIPTLYPIYKQFMNALDEVGLFVWEKKEDGEWPEHTKIDRPFYGVSNGNANYSYIFEDPLDAIEILDLKIGSYNKNCL